ncbi:MAG: flippase-like domain-containing protein [Syntrophaceae bacterium]|nr:flippase-like domain-containing protein [Syntrophaceae bacterium]
MKKILLGIILSIFLVYLSLRGIQFRIAAESIRNIQLFYVILSLLMMFLMQVLRSIRWGGILNPVVRVDQFTLFSITSVGFLAIVAIPARLGEVVRPLLISQKKNVPMAAALGTVFVERIMDTFTVLLMAGLLFPLIPLPPWLVRSVSLITIIVLASAVFFIFLIIKRKSLEDLERFLPSSLRIRYSGKISRLIGHFIDGFAVITDWKQLTWLLVLSVAVWIVDVLAIYALFLAFGYSLSFLAAFVLMFILIVGIAIPTAPGFIGNWHYACILALTLFGLAKTDALTFAIVYHALSIGIVLILGLVFLPFNRFSFLDLKNRNNLN